MQMLDAIFNNAKVQFGSAVKSRWFHDEDPCPGCGKKVGATKWKGEDALSLNAFIYREHSVLIGYLLCGKCAKKVIKATDDKTPLHLKIEETLKRSFLRRSGH